MTDVLLVENDPVTREDTHLSLERHGFSVRSAADGLAALELLRSREPDLAVLDVVLPRLDGIGLCRRIREGSSLPIIMLSARMDPVDVVQGLEAGADDYLAKPFDSAVLVARIRAVLRRTSPGGEEPSDGIVRTFGDLEVNTAAMEVRRAGRPVTLTPTEMRLLLEFAASPGVVLGRETLLERVWDHAWEGDNRVVDVHVQRLRSKIGAERLVTVRGFGYKLKR